MNRIRIQGAAGVALATVAIAAPTIAPALAAASTHAKTASHHATKKKHPPTLRKRHVTETSPSQAAPSDPSDAPTGTTGLDGIDDNSTNPAVFAAQQILLTVGEVVTPANLQAILAQLPGSPPYGSLN